VGDDVHVTGPSALDNGLMPTAYVLSNGVVEVRMNNFTAGAINPASGTYKILVRI
jgi:hypothetical protein